MNIFFVSRSPKRCARALDDKRLNKMILETTQLICTVINLKEGSQVTPYRNSHVNHPITKWVQDHISEGSLYWLYQLGIAYGEERQWRGFPKHACHLVLEGLELNFWEYIDIPAFMYNENLEFPNNAKHTKLGIDYTHLPIKEAYRAYLKHKWKKVDKRKPTWKRRGKPKWL